MGSVASDEGSKPEIPSRIVQMTAASIRLKPVWVSGAFLSVPRLTDALPCHIHLPVCFGIMGSHSRAAKKNTSNGNEVLPQGITNLKQGPCYQQGSLCQDPTGNWTTRRPPDLLTIVKRCKLQWYGHVSCSSGLAQNKAQ